MALRGKSELHRARVPGESRGGAGRRRRQSRLARRAAGARATETKPARRRTGVKRAILPAAISDSAVIRWLAEAGSREPPRRRGRGRSQGTERDDHRRTELGLRRPDLARLTMVPLAQSAERLSVEQEVTGSSPVRHPHKNPRNCAGSFISSWTCTLTISCRVMLRLVPRFPFASTCAPRAWSRIAYARSRRRPVHPGTG